MPDELQGNGAPEAPQGNGAQNPQGDSNDDAPKYVTKEELVQVVNQVFTSRDKAKDKQRAKRDEALVNTIIERLQPKPNDDDGDEDDGDDDSPTPPAAGSGKPTKPTTPAESPDPLAAMKAQWAKDQRKAEKRLRELEAKTAKAEQEAAAAKKRERDASLQTAVTDRLSALGIEGRRAKMAFGHLAKVEGRIYFDEDDEIVFRDEHGAEVPLADGLSEWAKSEDAELFMAPTGARGSGDRPRGKPPSTTKDPREKARETIARHLIG